MLTMENSLKLLEEINRIGGLIGRRILSEQVWSKVVDELVDFVGKTSSKLDNTSKYIIQDLKNSMGDKEIVENLLKLFKHNPDLGKQIYKIIIDELPVVTKNEIENVKTFLDTNIRNGTITDAQVDNMVRDWPNSRINTSFDELRQIIRKDLQDVVDNARRSANPNSATPKVDPTTWEKTSADLTSITRTELEKLERLYRAKGLGSSFLKAYRQFVQEVIDMFTKQDVLIDEMQRLSTSIKNTSDIGARTDMIERLGDLIQRLVQKDKENYKVIDMWLDKNVLDYDILKKIKNTAGYDRAGELLSGQAKKDWDAKYKSLFSRRKALLSQLGEILLPTRWFGKGNKYQGVFKKWGAIFKSEDFAEFRRWAVLGQTQSWAGIKSTYEKFGLPTAILSLGGELAYSYLVLATVYAVTDYLTDVGAAKFKDVQFLNNYQWFKDQVQSYEEHVVTHGEGGENTVLDMISYLTDELKSMQVQFPGIIDNIAVIWAGIRWAGAKDGTVTKEDNERIEQLRDKAKEEMDKIKQKADSLGNSQNQGDTTATEEQPITEPSGTYGTTLGEFKRYLASADGWGNEISFLKTVKTEEINGVEYYIATDTDGKEYFYTYNDGKFTQY